MTTTQERIEITITGALPETDKYRILAAAQAAANTLGADLSESHPGLVLTVSVRPVRANTKAAKVALRAAAE